MLAEMCLYFLMFITAVCFLFLLKLRWPKTKVSTFLNPVQVKLNFQNWSPSSHFFFSLKLHLAFVLARKTAFWKIWKYHWVYLWLSQPTVYTGTPSSGLTLKGSTQKGFHLKPNSHVTHTPICHLAMALATVLVWGLLRWRWNWCWFAS